MLIEPHIWDDTHPSRASTLGKFTLVNNKEQSGDTPPISIESEPTPSSTHDSFTLPPIPENAPYTIRTSPGRGLGIFTTRPIPAGTRLIAEPPLLSVPHGRYRVADLEARYAALTPSQQALYASLGSSHTQRAKHWGVGVYKHIPRWDLERVREIQAIRCAGVKSVGSIFVTNCMGMGADGEGAGVFPTAARCNHSCVPNACFAWNERLGAETVHAVRDLEMGEEVLVSYCYVLHARDLRRWELRGYGFECECEVCEGDSWDVGSKVARSLARRARVSELDEWVGKRVKMFGLGFEGPEEVPGKNGEVGSVDGSDEGLLTLAPSREVLSQIFLMAIEMVSLLRDEGLVCPLLAGGYMTIALLCVALGDLNFAIDAAQKGLDTFLIIYGDDHYRAIETAARVRELKVKAGVGNTDD
ncbi:SET domain-containing protein [Patellaria atrata CBS 101060]|uniref:SET domain-containing protein n=1 Tax=Patellaria atrata CBS 101060 TaxID=1346257 RepID=A0A9P4VJM7_9PEZI|nr:SET domain-containing protein [Patellaria atrata CBS 101060]